ncbi:MAG: hypothetical protein IPO35_17750 [Uliginosibacterium sp.]|nr:hypothetical protein [Uliginosibacterium sp.]
MTSTDVFPEGYKQIDHPQLGDKAVHPELYDSLKIVFESSQPDVVTAGLLGASMAIKRAQVFGSLFHAKSLGEVYVLAMGSDMLPRPGDLTRPKRIIDEALNKFRTQGLGGEIEGLIKAGIKFGIPDDVSTTIVADVGALADSATGVKLGSKVAEKIDYVNKHLDNATWDYMHTGVKASVALKEVENLIRNNAELHALDPKKYRLKSKEEIYQEVAGTVKRYCRRTRLVPHRYPGQDRTRSLDCPALRQSTGSPPRTDHRICPGLAHVLDACWIQVLRGE